MAWFPCNIGGGAQILYEIEQGTTYDSEDAQTISDTVNGKLYLFFTGNHSGTFTNADLLVGSVQYFELLDGIGVAAGIIRATVNSITYDGAWSGLYHITEIDILKNGVEDLNIECNDKSNWTSTTTLTAQVGDYYIIADTVDNDGGTVVGAETLIEETLTTAGTNLNIKIRIVKATSTSITLSSGNNLCYRKFSLCKPI